MEARYSAEEWTLEEARRVAPPGQFIAVERWYRNEPRGGSTLICTHANGTTKEVRGLQVSADDPALAPRPT